MFVNVNVKCFTALNELVSNRKLLASSSIIENIIKR